MAHYAGVDCLTSVYPMGGGWVGKSTTGEVHRFRTLDDYKEYLKALEKNGRICANVSVPVATASKKREWTPPTGFLEFKPRNQYQQDMYSAMSSSWLGEEASSTAIDKGLFAEETSYFYKNDKKLNIAANDYKPTDTGFPVWNPLG